jgi:signal transduction histidine kinase/CheY-like chemotaxis protein
MRTEWELICRRLQCDVASVSLLQAMFENTPVPMQIFHCDGHSLIVNPALVKWIGVGPPPEYNVLEDQILVRQGLTPLLRRAFEGEAMTLPAAWYDALELQDVDTTGVIGGRIGIEATLLPLRDREGVVQFVMVWGRDVTAELELRLREERQHLAFGAARMIALDTNLTKGILRLSDNARKVLGLRPETRLETLDDLLALIHPDDRASFEAMERGGAPGNAPDPQFRFQRPLDGVVMWLERRSQSWHDTVSDDMWCRGILMDMTERVAREATLRQKIEESRRAEEALRGSEARFRNLFEHSPDCLWEEDFSAFKTRMDELRASGVKDIRAHLQSHPEEVRSCLQLIKVLDVNQACVQLYEANDKADLIDGLGRILAPESFWTLTQLLSALSEGKTVFEVEGIDQTFTGKKNHILLKALIAPGCETTLSRVYVSIVDITARKALEEQLRRSQKMEAVGHLAGGIAHDFNNLLTVIQGNTALLQMSNGAHEQRAEALADIAHATERAAALTRQLLTVSKRQELQPKTLDLNEIVTGLARMLQRVVGEDVRTQINLHPRRLITRADAAMLDQVLMNLVVNARDAMPEGGQLVIETSEATIANADLDQFPDARPGRHVSLRVTDTGHGISHENLARIFEPFFTTKEQGKNTGLGLATVFGIVKQHRGALTVTSDVGQGTTFVILLPAIEGDVVSRKQDAAEPRGGTESILLVEDEESVRRLVQHLLEMHGYRVQAASSGVEALHRMEQRLDEFDLVITDIVMPGGVSGWMLAERLLQTRPRLKVIYMSGYMGDTANRRVNLRDGVNFLQKPFGRIPLLKCVRACLDGA